MCLILPLYCRGTNKVTLNWKRPLWESDQEVVKRSGRDEPIHIAMHMCMEAMLGISLHSFLYFKLANMLCLFFLLFICAYNVWVISSTFSQLPPLYLHSFPLPPTTLLPEGTRNYFALISNFVEERV
jgi:hypothetical protein